jgi:hypothetical protein
MSLAQNQNRQSTIDWIEEGKTWSGKDGTEMKEYKVSLKNGDIPVFNYPSNKPYPFAKGDNVTYLLNERMVNKKIIQNGKQMKKVENNQATTTTSTTTNTSLTQQQSIALSVASKLGFETVTSDAWQKTLKFQDTEKRAQAQSELLSSIGQVTIAYYNLLTTKPQNNVAKN